MAQPPPSRTDPREGKTRKQIKAMCADYMGAEMTVREVARRHAVGTDKLRQILKLEGCKLRGRDFALRKSRFRMGKGPRLGEVFCGMKVDVRAPDGELGKAKLILMRRGRIVFNAEINGGPKGMIRCDRLLVTPDELIAMAGALV